MTAFSPGASPPPVEIAMRISARARDQLQNLSRLWMAPERLLREDQVSIHGNLEDTAGRRDQADVGFRHLFLQLSRQTGGSRLVVSDDAVLDDHAHARLLAKRTRAVGIVAVPGSEAKGPHPGTECRGDGAPCQSCSAIVSI